MATPTIIIGIGSSGLYTLENVQRFYYETHKVNKPDNVEYLYIETSNDNQVGITPIADVIRRVYISTDDMQKMNKELRKNGAGEWLPPEELVLQAGIGAGNIRCCGRLALWGTNSSEGDHFKNVIEAILYAYAKVSNPNVAETDKLKPTVFITGSFTGGTGSGIFIDMAYIVRHIITDIKHIYGLFLLPPKPASIKREEVSYANSYAALRDLDYYNQLHSRYKENWPNDVKIDNIGPPYELAQFISQDYNDGSPAISNLGGLYKMAGLFLFLNISGVFEKRMDLLVNAKPAGHIDKYGTFGLSAIQFPKDQIQEYLSCVLSKELIERWIDSTHYISNNDRKPHNPSLINQDTAQQFDRILESAFATLNNIGGGDLIAQIEREAIKINSKNIQGDAQDYIIRLFKSSSEDNYYSTVKNHLQIATNTVIDEIHDLIINTLNQYENLYYLKNVLDGIKTSIARTLNYWQIQLNLSSRTEHWDNMLRDLAGNSQKHKYVMVLEQDNVLKDRLVAIFETMKMHLFGKKLDELKNYLTNPDHSIKSSVSNKELPRTTSIDKLIKKLAELIGTVEAKENIFTLGKRMKNIEDDIKDDTIPILRVYPTDSFSSSWETSKQIYIQKTNSNSRSKSEIIGNENLWDYLNKIERLNFHNDLYKQSINGFRDKISLTGCVQDYDVIRFVQINTNKSTIYARRALSPLISTSNILRPSPKLPRFIAGSDEGSIKEVVSAFKSNSFHDFTDAPDRMLELENLKNILIFYDERGGFSPISDISYIDQMKSVYENQPSDWKLGVDVWKTYRDAYTIS